LVRPRPRRATARPLFDLLDIFFLDRDERPFELTRFEREEDFLDDTFCFAREADLRDFDPFEAGAANAIEQVSTKASINDSAFILRSPVNVIIPVLYYSLFGLMRAQLE
jgi:hypothetical protein